MSLIASAFDLCSQMPAPCGQMARISRSLHALCLLARRPSRSRTAPCATVSSSSACSSVHLTCMASSLAYKRVNKQANACQAEPGSMSCSCSGCVVRVWELMMCGCVSETSAAFFLPSLIRLDRFTLAASLRSLAIDALAARCLARQHSSCAAGVWWVICCSSLAAHQRAQAGADHPRGRRQQPNRARSALI